IKETLDIPLRWTEILALNPTPRSELDLAVANFKRLLADADRQALKNNNVVPQRLVADVETAFRACNAKLNSIEGELNKGIDERNPRHPTPLDGDSCTQPNPTFGTGSGRGEFQTIARRRRSPGVEEQ